MGHQNKRYVQKFLKSKGIDVKLDSEFCDACMYGKMHRPSFGSRQHRRSSPGQLVRADVCGPVPEKFLECRLHVERASDGGGEFNNSEVHQIIQKEGLSHLTSMPYTPEQNGVIKRENRILVETARSRLHAKNLPEKLSAEAVNTAAYDLNRTGTTPEAGKSLYEIWFKRKPFVDHLKIFLALNALFTSQSRKEGSLIRRLFC
ncbi:hypothetical protein AVEN_113952-1 [Araneus ventricosus]|uniref:Integrase catalytic domain-containing protein n=1 Tax=Araneus ventricosus TaxID=182803 RepID=A0A4Y2IVW7_ARAVE|nr:hypothetical protein AVEN_113952-1 [Araneus ventricosus]